MTLTENTDLSCHPPTHWDGTPTLCSRGEQIINISSWIVTWPSPSARRSSYSTSAGAGSLCSGPPSPGSPPPASVTYLQYLHIYNIIYGYLQARSPAPRHSGTRASSVTAWPPRTRATAAARWSCSSTGAGSASTRCLHRYLHRYLDNIYTSIIHKILNFHRTGSLHFDPEICALVYKTELGTHGNYNCDQDLK